MVVIIELNIKMLNREDKIVQKIDFYFRFISFHLLVCFYFFSVK
jgi:hypothetical protein